VLALDLDDAKTISLIAVTVLVIGAIAALWFLQTLARKLLFSAIAVAFAFAVWSQREALVECADKVSESFVLAEGNPTLVDTDCTFFGATVTISDPRSDDDAG
jgi:hypothetical protein